MARDPGLLVVEDAAGNGEGVRLGMSSATHSSGRAAAITPSDTDKLDYPIRSFYVGSVGDVKVLTVEGDTVTYTAVPTGTIIPCRAIQVFSTGTSASSITGMY